MEQLVTPDLEPVERGDTALVDAAYSALSLGTQQGSRSLIFIFTDGLETASVLAPTDVLAIAGYGGSVVYAVTTTTTSEPTFLEKLVAQTGGRIGHVARSQQLGGTFLEFIDEFHHRYVLSYRPRSLTPGWHRLDVRVHRANVRVVARSGYFEP
jgi:hypothetical protein